MAIGTLAVAARVATAATAIMANVLAVVVGIVVARATEMAVANKNRTEVQKKVGR